MYKFEVTCSFVTKSVEQAEHIRKFFDDAQALMTCESSSFSSTEIMEFGLREKPPVVHELEFESHGEASTLLEALRDISSTYGLVTVADLHELAGVTGHFTDSKWGWEELPENITIKRSKYGWVLNLPKPDFIDHVSRSNRG